MRYRPMVLLAASLVWLAACTSTPAFRDTNGRIVPGSIASMEDLPIGGLKQRIWLRGLNQEAPILVLLHGGPGTNESPMFRFYDSELERHFLVVYWEQRGTGRSYRSDIPPETMTIERFVSDLDELVDHLTSRFREDRVILAGHSWGTVVGTLYTAKHPEKVSAYVGIGQIADMPEGETLSYRFALEQARLRNRLDAVSELEAIGPPPHDVDATLISRKWVERFGGSFAGDLSTGKLIWTALRTEEVNLKDLVLFGQGNRFSLEYLWPELREVSLAEHATNFAVPVVFMLGRYDHQIPASLAASYFDRINAPAKMLIWFEHSGHNPPFEEPAKFVNSMINEILPLTATRP